MFLLLGSTVFYVVDAGAPTSDSSVLIYDEMCYCHHHVYLFMCAFTENVGSRSLGRITAEAALAHPGEEGNLNETAGFVMVPMFSFFSSGMGKLIAKLKLLQ